MAEQSQRHGSASGPGSASGQAHPTQHALSCTHCRQRKIRCDKVHPCAPCQRSSLECVFPERVRHPKKKRSGSKTTNDELVQRLGRMEELIEKMKTEGKDFSGNKVAQDRGSRSPSMPQISREASHGSRSQDDGGSDATGEGTTRYIGGSFFRSLTNEVQGLKQTMNDVSDEEEMPESSRTPSDTQTPNTLSLFGASPRPIYQKRLTHPPTRSMSTLCELYVENCDPMFKVLHIPGLRKFVAHAATNVENIPSGNYVEALLFAMYYAAITSLTQEECLQNFPYGRDHLLARYRIGVETALADADLLNTTEMGTLQALVIFLISARTNDDSQFVWTMTSIAIRLAHSMGLHRENSRANLSPFQTEMRRRLWWSIVHLDIRCVEDRGSDPFVLDNSFNTKRPLNIHDTDMDPDSWEPIIERHEFTAYTKTHLSDLFWGTAVRVGHVSPVKEGAKSLPSIPIDQKLSLVDQQEKRLERDVLVYCDPANPLAWVTSTVVRLVMARLRLAIYHPPMHDDRSPYHQSVGRDTVLKTAVQILEYSHLLDTEPAAAKWRWYFRTHVQWHALAAVLAEMCVQNKGPLVERAWTIVDVVFDEWSARIADSKNGMLWRPIKKLMSKAQAKRNEAKQTTSSSVSQQQQPLPQFDTISPLQDPNFANVPFHPDSVLGLSQRYNLEQGLPSDILSSLNVSDTEGTINWAEWDEFMQDFEMTDPGAMDPNTVQQDPSFTGTWW